MSRFRKKGAAVEAKKKGHISPMQKRDWAKGMEVSEATEHLVSSLTKSANWSGNDLLYLNALWDATNIVARELGYIDEE